MDVIDYSEGSNLLRAALDRAVEQEGLTFIDALDIYYVAIVEVLREAVRMRREEQEREPVAHHPACVEYGDDSGCNACNGG